MILAIPHSIPASAAIGVAAQYGTARLVAHDIGEDAYLADLPDRLDLSELAALAAQHGYRLSATMFGGIAFRRIH